ncbi:MULTISPECIES: DUF4097 family beta strand repeat-containing protein [Halorussus]|uniref:DUF4097 family beta strand repeat-containing protein n=1 Tax=Halorussus TaxID=1070314 RepID=UPI000E2132DD|nr:MULTISPECIES: DUF4097 family beta strand repeat-containing protein [Halorussus]NHN59676.1 DUF4097 domain-containing protein [Halorussus sp. JP-T4]
MNVDTQRRRLLGLSAAAGLTALSGCSGVTPFVGKRLENAQSFDASSVDAVSVAGRNGNVRVRPRDDERIRVETVKKAGSVFADLDDVRVETTTENGELRVAARKVGDGSWLAGVPSVDVTVGLPASVDLGELRTENGRVDVRNVATDATLGSENGQLEARNVDGFVSAETENGRVVARDVTGIDGARSENGSVEIDVKSVRGDTDVATENGRVTAAVSPDLNAEVVATTGNGRVEFDVASAEVSTRRSGRVEATLGGGGPELRLSCENGRVSVSQL